MQSKKKYQMARSERLAQESSRNQRLPNSATQIPAGARLHSSSGAEDAAVDGSAVVASHFNKVRILHDTRL